MNLFLFVKKSVRAAKGHFQTVVRPRRLALKPRWVTGGMLCLGLSSFWMTQVYAEEPHFVMDLSFEGVKNLLEAYQKHRQSETAAVVVGASAIVVADLFLFTGTGIAGFLFCCLVVVAHIYENLEPVIPTSPWDSRLQRRRFMDVPDEMALLLAMYHSHIVKEENTILPPNHSQHRRCSKIGSLIVNASQLKLPAGQTWEFHVIDSKEANAFVFANGQVFVHSGLMEHLEDDEIAFVLSHEVAHVQAKHLQERLSIQRFPEILKWTYRIFSFAGVFTLDSVLPGGAVVEMLSTLILYLPYSRIHEEEADIIALDHLVQAKIHPSAALRACDKFIELHKDQLTSSQRQVATLFQTHPCWEDRRKILERVLPEKEVEFKRLTKSRFASVFG